MTKKQKKSSSLQKVSVLALVVGIVSLLAFLHMKDNTSMTPYKKNAPVASGDGILSIPIPEHNFGTVKLKGGVVSTTFPLVNIGEGDLTITFLDSSCGCTSAQIVNGDKKGPVFGMASHSKSPRDWQTTIQPGQQAQLVVFYDPSVHPKFRGAATRVITIYSNDKVQRTKTVKIRVNQIG